jgi:hypothetical protein
MRRTSYAVVAAVGVVSAATAAGVTYAVVHHDAHAARQTAAPVVFTGALRDRASRPVANAVIQLMVSDDAHAKIGQMIRSVGLASGHTDTAGRFTIRQPKSVPIIRKLAAENGGWVNFDVLIRAPAGLMPWAFSRKIGQQGWMADEDMPAGLKQERITFKALAKG